MLIISARDNESNRWKREATKTKNKGTKEWRKVYWKPLELNDFVLFSLFHLLFSLSLTLIISIFHCLNYTSLLLHLITTHLASHLSPSSIVLIISTLITDTFYCLNYTSQLLYLIITHLVNICYNNYVIKRCPRQLLWFI